MKRARTRKKPLGRPVKPEGRSPVIAGRVPESLHRKIKAAAEASGRSMSEEMAWRLEQSFAGADIAEVVRTEIRNTLTSEWGSSRPIKIEGEDSK